MTASSREWTIGPNILRFEPPDALWTEFHGECSQAQAIEMVRLYRELGQLRPFFILSDMEAAGGMDSEARRYMSEHLRGEWLLGIIFFKARLLHRALAQGLILAAEMARMVEGAPRPKVYFVSNRDKALELLGQLREQAGREGAQNWK